MRFFVAVWLWLALGCGPAASGALVVASPGPGVSQPPAQAGQGRCEPMRAPPAHPTDTNESLRLDVDPEVSLVGPLRVRAGVAEALERPIGLTLTLHRPDGSTATHSFRHYNRETRCRDCDPLPDGSGCDYDPCETVRTGPQRLELPPAWLTEDGDYTLVLEEPRSGRRHARRFTVVGPDAGRGGAIDACRGAPTTLGPYRRERCGWVALERTDKSRIVARRAHYTLQATLAHYPPIGVGQALPSECRDARSGPLVPGPSAVTRRRSTNAPLDLETGLARVRAIVAGPWAQQPGVQLRDPALERWLVAVVAELRRATGRGQLPFTPGEKREPVVVESRFYADCAPQLIDGDIATHDAHIGSISRAMVLVDGDVTVGFIRDSIVIATGRVRAAFVDHSVVIAGGEIRASGGRRYAQKQVGIPNILLSGSTVRGPSWGAIVGAPDGADWQAQWGNVMVSSPAMQAVAPGASVQSALVLAPNRVSPEEGRYEAAVGGGPRPKVCVSEAGRRGVIACGREGQELDGSLRGWRIAFNSPDLVTLAREDERIRIRPTRPSLRPSGTLRPPPDAEVHAVGVYTSPLPYGNVKVRVRRQGAPVVLVLMAYEEVSWEIEAAPGVQIAGVVLAGFRVSRLRGLPPRTPVVTRIHELGERPFRTHERGDPKLLRGLKDALGREIVPSSFVGFEHAPPIVTVPPS